jgi:hypothetical protein
MRVAQQFLAALARDWDSPLDALRNHLENRELEKDHDKSPHRNP